MRKERLPGAPDPKRVEALVEMIKPFLAHEGPAIQGAVLADLTAIWLAGMLVTDASGARPSVVETRRTRAHMLRSHVRMVQELIEPNARIMGTPV